MPYPILILMAVVAGLAVYCGYLEVSLSQSERKAETYGKANEENLRALEDLRENLRRSEAALAVRDSELKNIEREAEALHAELLEATRKGDAADWGDMPVPHSVGLLLSGACDHHENGEGVAAGDADLGNARAQVDGQKQ